jgi:uncharacterized protein (DUF885 family)
MALSVALAPVSTAAETSPLANPERLVDGYIEAYFSVFPSRATAAGRHDRDRDLETLGASQRRWWTAHNEAVAEKLGELLAGDDLSEDERLDVELVRRHALRQIHDFKTLRRPERDPLFWTRILGNATVFLLVRDDTPEAEGLAAAAARARKIPRLAREAQTALSATASSRISPELCAIASRQAAASARFYRQGFAGAAAEDNVKQRRRLASAGRKAADALDALAVFLEKLEQRATGSPRLRENYATSFRLATGLEDPDIVLPRAEAALAAKRTEAAAFARQVWGDYFDERPPFDDVELLRRMFARVAEDRADRVDSFVEQYRSLIRDSIDFVRRHDVITLPEPLTLFTDRSPSFFVGQSVGGVYPAGPYAPQGKTLFYLPTPSDTATDEQRDAFFRDFNDHFNVMITPHEIVPGHYLQLKYAAQHPRKARALFGDGVYIEGWGTFCERLMLDLGWGDPLDRLAHLKKQMENIARTIVDIRVHTRGMKRESVLAYVRDEALQDEQFASNMWTRSITSAPQLTYYFLGYEQVFGLYEEVRAARGDAFELKAFMDAMMELGPVPVRYYRNRLLD